MCRIKKKYLQIKSSCDNGDKNVGWEGKRSVLVILLYGFHGNGV